MKFAAALFLLMPLAATAQISLSSAVDLAEKNSTSVRAAIASVQKAAARPGETKEAYIPNFVLGVSPGYSYGFPLGYPSLFNASPQSLVFSWSQKDYMRAAHTALNAANLNLKDVQQQTALDVALAYVQLDSDLKELAALQQQSGFAETLVQLEQDRVNAGVDPRMTELEAELTAAQVDAKAHPAGKRRRGHAREAGPPYRPARDRTQHHQHQHSCCSFRRHPGKRAGCVRQRRAFRGLANAQVEVVYGLWRRQAELPPAGGVRRAVCSLRKDAWIHRVLQELPVQQL